MGEQPISSRMYQIGVQKQDLERRAYSLIGVQRMAFQEMSVRNPRFSPPELGFYQTVTWLYALYYESGRISLRFLMDRFNTYGYDQNGHHRRHYEDTGRLRTYLQHNLNLDSIKDAKTHQICEEWFSKACGSAIPSMEREWNECLVRILNDSELFLAAVIDCVRAIERDESSKLIVEQWTVRLRQFHPKHEFEDLVAMVIHDVGQDSLDPVQITERYYDQWTRNLKFRSEDYIFIEDARRLIEQTILNEAELPPPISGADIMRELGIPPGPDVGILLRKAKDSYDVSPCTADELINRLKSLESDN